MSELHRLDVDEGSYWTMARRQAMTVTVKKAYRLNIHVRSYWYRLNVYEESYRHWLNVHETVN